ncbi:MAG: DUF4416 family protein [Desulfohalobiaceae bacterium]
MSKFQQPLPAQPILSILSSSWDEFWPALLQELEPELGLADYISEPFAFTETSYYNQELGVPILRRILAFEPLMPRQGLVRIKLLCHNLELSWARSDANRLFNLDPGYLTLEQLVLATGKNFTHRIYLDQGVYADLTLVYSKGGWQTLPWTYPDYGGRLLQEILNQLRQRYKQKLRHRSGR